VLLLIIEFQEEDWRRHAHLFSEMIGGIVNVTWEQQATLSMVHVPMRFNDIGSYLHSLVEEDTFDGVLLRIAGDLSEDYLTPLAEAGFPYVVIKRYLPHRRINCVVNDDVQGAFMATEHLIKLGYTRIGLIVSNQIVVGRDRSRGFFEALEAYGLEADPDLVRYTDDFMEETGRRVTSELLVSRHRPEAIFAPSDILAMGAYHAVEEAGLRIPEDVAIVGYDDIPPAAQLSPPLTTVRTPYYDFGVQSASLLLDIINQKVRPPQKVVIEQSLVVRESCGAGLQGGVEGQDH